MIELEILVPDWPAEATGLIERTFDRACLVEGIDRGTCFLRITGDAEIREINREMRGIDRATDVLSFPSIRYPAGRTASTSRKRLSGEIDPQSGCIFLGDVIISLERALAQAEEYGHSPARELAYLTAHAALHLMGYDHEMEAERAQMRALEEQIMDSVGQRRDG